MANAGKVIVETAKRGISLRRALVFTSMILWFIFIIAVAGIHSYEQKSFEPFINDVFGKFAEPTLKLQESSQYIIEKNNIFETRWEKIVAYFDIFTNIYTIIIWFIILNHIFVWLLSVVSGLSTFILSFMFFFLGQTIFIIFINPDMSIVSAMSVPISAFISLYNAISLIV